MSVVLQKKTENEYLLEVKTEKLFRVEMFIDEFTLQELYYKIQEVLKKGE